MATPYDFQTETSVIEVVRKAVQDTYEFEADVFTTQFVPATPDDD